ncbi:DUF3592 domain-containing protein [Kitasatospora purpeofusca]|uniref:DUF3592 domain-containing protein n=1 Tax=Kitasatospora purpeofusca TaxID=67352 RepID=UPI002252A33E|nr:DUF3592 domain-containing protein [Kitasatospora purpeofusca]MCX4757102.1 DUF3592 domain-containing protein [Kitasatospora purpeofusca]WSR35136.1 DUF3592 domain-containing protein [Kitasatospora purpeofusca]WSR43456.1 DUF3592 domain-containing protein [Kitasatospora purpeofusca]
MGTTTGVVAALAVFTGLGGLVACLSGVAGLRELRRLHRSGVSVWALVRERLPGPEDRSAVSRPLLQFTTEDGRVVEVFSPVPSSRRRPLVDGSHVPIRYDPADPRQVLVAGLERRRLEYAFLGLGCVMAITAVVLAVLVLLGR